MGTELRPFTQPEHQPFALGEGPGSVLLLHGFAGTPAEVRPLGRALAASGWHVRAPLLPGFGPDIVNLDQYGRRDWLAAARREWDALCAGDGPRVLLGFSMGGALALHLAQAHPPDRLVLIAPFHRMPGILPRLIPVARLFKRRMRLLKDADFDDPARRAQIEQMMPGINLDDPATQEAIRNEATMPLSAMHELLRLGREAYRLAPQVSAPMLVIQGLQDQVARPAETRRLVKRLRQAEVTVHELPAEHDLIQSHSALAAPLAALVIEYLGDLL